MLPILLFLVNKCQIVDEHHLQEVDIQHNYTIFLLAGSCTLSAFNSLVLSLQILLRAQFDNNPENDKFIPCPEVGLKFKKGDILRVLSKDDYNWWQVNLSMNHRDLSDILYQKVNVVHLCDQWSKS